MGKPTGFIEYEREKAPARAPAERIHDYAEFQLALPEDALERQAARCMDCGIPFCQAGVLIGGMASGCPINNLIPEWNHLVYTGRRHEAYLRLSKTNDFPEFTGRVCPAPCEGSCTVGINSSPVTVKKIELEIIAALPGRRAGSSPSRPRCAPAGVWPWSARARRGWPAPRSSIGPATT